MARAPDPNFELLVRVAEALGELRSRFVFVGGCATGLLITDPAAPAARPTHDVDIRGQTPKPAGASWNRFGV